MMGLIKNDAEYRLHRFLMPRNEEEVMRNVVILSNQMKSRKDSPQVMITFDEQSETSLYFNIILTRLLKSDSCSLMDLFKCQSTTLQYLHERTKIVGYVRKKYPKEATLFRLKLAKDRFLRKDGTIDLIKARQMIVSELSRLIGPVRHYNGGMLAKQKELLEVIRTLLVDHIDDNELLLEDFFYSLSPLVFHTALDPMAFKVLFCMLLRELRAYRQAGEGSVDFSSKNDYTFALIIGKDFSLRDSLHQVIQELQIPSHELIRGYVSTQGAHCIGYIYRTLGTSQRELFFQAVLGALSFTPRKKFAGCSVSFDS